MDSILYYLEKTSASSYLKFSIPFTMALFLGVTFVLLVYMIFRYIIIPTKRKHDEELKELERLHANEQALMFMNGVEQERKRIALDLHDNIIQTLSAANIRLEALKLNNNLDVNPINEVSGIIRKSTSDIRDLINNITPADLSKIGFEDAIKNYLRSIRGFSKINYIIDLKSFPAGLDQNTNIMLYRILQEVLNNIEKHSKATEALLSCSIIDGQFLIEASDNGCGFDINDKKNEAISGFGLSNMEYRVSILGGEISIESGEGDGTKIIIAIPLEKKKNGNPHKA
ncbi:MAG: sensor histidine kinase [Ignavibacteriaceae bacterium]|nr:sensor histidine kinase [Ignavibacteriaceae bacterium]